MTYSSTVATILSIALTPVVPVVKILTEMAEMSLIKIKAAEMAARVVEAATAGFGKNSEMPLRMR